MEQLIQAENSGGDIPGCPEPGQGKKILVVVAFVNDDISDHDIYLNSIGVV
jgi:hypothetical protein